MNKADIFLYVWRTELASVSKQAKSGCVEKAIDGTYKVTCNKGAIFIREISYEKRTYSQSQLDHVFGNGGQILGD